VKPSSIHLHASRLLQLKYNLDNYVAVAAKETFRLMDDNGNGIIGRDEWRNGNLHLPRAYNKLRIMFSVMVNPRLEGFRPCFANYDSMSSTKDFVDELWTCFFSQAQLETLLVERVVEYRVASLGVEECLVTWDNFKGAPSVWVPKATVLKQVYPASGRLNSRQISLWQEFVGRPTQHRLIGLTNPDSVRRFTRNLVGSGYSASTATAAAELVRSAASHMVKMEVEQQHSGQIVKAATAWWAPASIEFAGRDCDYQGGKVATMAISRGVALVVAPREDSIVRIYAAATPQEQQLPLCPDHPGSSGYRLDLKNAKAATMEESRRDPVQLPAGWGRAVVAVANHLQHKFPRVNVKGADICICSNVPMHSNLHSTEGMAVAALIALSQHNKLDNQPILAPGIPIADFAAQALAVYDTERGDFWYDQQMADGLTSAGTLAAAACMMGKIGRFEHSKQHAEGHCSQSVSLPAGYHVVVAALGTAESGKEHVETARSQARAAHVAWQSGTRRTTEVNLAEAHEMSLTPATMAKAVRFHFRSGGEDRDPLPGSIPTATTRVQAKIPQGERYHPDKLVDRVLDFAQEQDAVDLMFEAVQNLTITAGLEEEQALEALASQSFKRMESHLSDCCPSAISVVRKAMELGAVAAAPAGFGSVWAIVKAQTRAEVLRFEAAWRHAHAAEVDEACHIFASEICGGVLQLERGNYLD